MSGISSPSRAEIVVGKSGHVEDCLRIAESLPEYFNEAGLEEVWRSLSSDALYVAVENEHVVGFAAVSEERNERAEIAWLAVDPAHQRNGIGRALVRRIEERLARRGVRLLAVKTLAEEADYPPFEATRRFYERAGFKHVETVDPHPGWAGDPAAVYVKELFARKEEQSWRK